MDTGIIYACSHRKGGNSDRAAELLAEGVRRAGGKANILYVRDHDVQPCLACGHCDKSAGVEGLKRCVLGRKDEAWQLFEPMFTARAVFFSSPIYFYHVPSMFKTWMDRGQQFWKAWMDKEPWIDDLPRRTAHAVLIAGQPSGDKLFEGARLSIKYFVQNFNMDLADPLTFRGIDARTDLRARQDSEERIVSHATAAWQSAS